MYFRQPLPCVHSPVISGLAFCTRHDQGYNEPVQAERLRENEDEDHADK